MGSSRTPSTEVGHQLVTELADTASTRSAAATIRRIVSRAAIPVLIFVVFIALWESAVAVFEVPEYILPRPSAIWASFSGEWAEIGHHTKLTAIEAFLGYLIGNGTAIIMAAFLAEFPFLERNFYPYVVLNRSLPIVTVAPLLIIWFGFTIWPIVIAAALICFFPTLVNGIQGFKSADPTMLELMRGLNASRWQTFSYVKLPTALPYIFAALKTAVASAMVGAVVGEWIAADEGLGFLTIRANNFVDTLLLFRAVLAIGVLGVVWFVVVTVIEGRLLQWNRPERP
jgi:NitT/TauT family transport system permease protein